MASSRIKGITIKIDGNTTSLQKSLESVDKSVKKSEQNLKDINKLLKFDSDNTRLLSQKQKNLKEDIGKTKERLNQLKEAQKQVGKGTKEWDALQIEIGETEVKLKELKKEYRDFGSVAKQKLQDVGDKLKDVGEKTINAGKKVSTYVTAPIVAGFTAAVKVTADFDEAMSKVQAVSGASGDDFTQLRDKAREMGEKTKFSATEAAEAMNYMAMAGWKTESMLGGIDGVMNLAAASGEDLATTSDIVTDALTAFGMSADESGRLADILASASSNANTNVSMMGESFKYVAPVAGAMGYSAEDVSIALGLMANSGIKASQAGTSLRNIMQRMAKPTKESQAAMDRLGLSLQDDEGNMYSFREIMNQMRDSFGNINVDVDEYNKRLDQMDSDLEEGIITQKEYDKELEELNKQTFGAEGAEKARAAAMLGGARAMSALLAISNATEEDYQKLTTAVDTSSDAFAKLTDGSVVPLNEALATGAEVVETYNGQAEAMAATMQDNLAGQLTILKSQVSEVAISIGDILMPTIRDIVDVIQGWIDKFNNLDESQKELIVKIALVAAAIGPVIIVIGTLITSIGAIVTAIGLLLSPLGLVVAAIAAVIAIGVALYKNWDTICAWANTLKEKVIEAWNNLKETVVNAVTQLKEKVITQWNTLKTTVGNLVNLVKTNIVNSFTQAKEKVLGVFDSIKNGIVNKLESAKNFISGIIEKIKGIFNFNWSLPQLKLPHIVVGEYIDVPVLGRIPNPTTLRVDWYKKAYETPYLFTTPTIVNGRGFGDGVGGELVYGHDQLLKDIAAVSGGDTIVNIYPQKGMNANEIADAVIKRINFVNSQKARAYA